MGRFGITIYRIYEENFKDGYGKREEIKLRAGDMFRDELEMFAETCITGKPCELTAHNGNVAVAVVYAALQSIERKGQCVHIADVMDATRKRIGHQARAA